MAKRKPEATTNKDVAKELKKIMRRTQVATGLFIVFFKTYEAIRKPSSTYERIISIFATAVAQIIVLPIEILIYTIIGLYWITIILISMPIMLAHSIGHVIAGEIANQTAFYVKMDNTIRRRLNSIAWNRMKIGEILLNSIQQRRFTRNKLRYEKRIAH